MNASDMKHSGNMSLSDHADAPDSLLHLSDDDDTPLTLLDGDLSASADSKQTSGAGERRTLLIVDDETMLLEMLARLFNEHYRVYTAESGDAALALLQQGIMPEVIIADQRMPGMQGPEFLAQSRGFVPQAVRIILTGYTDVQDIIASINLGHVYRFITKPWNPEELLETVRISFEHHDISTRNKELADALARLEELNRDKTELMGIVAHDLKNPMGAIQTISDMMIHQGSEFSKEEHDDFLQLINAAATRALDLIQTLLSLEAMEQGSVTIECEALEIASIIEALVHHYKPIAEQKSIRLHLEQPASLNAFVESQTLHQILDNLLSNAIKYSPLNKNVWIKVSTRLEPKYLPEPDQIVLMPDSAYIIVEDEGPGFTENDKSSLFGKFARLSAQPTGGESSTGLGLSIVKRYVEAMRGSIWLISEVGKGAAFVVSLPQNAPPH
ncbi:MAG: hybrid sensor histidine kinase/response regulator [Candidatus Kapabacteria bacterium]|nr:hybrid sensor histidine kinase/response regulator [Candidatus Kapabacteria bacterium]